MILKYGKSIEVNNELKFNVDEQQVDIKNNVKEMMKLKFRKSQMLKPHTKE